MPSRVVVTGANSAVGRAILRAAAREHPPLTIVAAVRSDRARKEVEGEGAGEVALIAYDDPATLCAAFGGASAVIHLAGTLIERGDSTYKSANVGTARAVAAAAEQEGVGKLVLISAVAADPAARNRYWRSKGQAEEAVRSCRCAHTILRV